MRLLKTRTNLADADFGLLALAFNRGRVMRPFYLTAWVLLPDHWHIICAPVHPLTISQVMKSLKTSSTILINRRRAEAGELRQARFFDRALRTVEEYNEKVEYIHLNPVRAGLVGRPQDWRWSSVNEYSGLGRARPFWVVILSAARSLRGAKNLQFNCRPFVPIKSIGTQGDKLRDAPEQS